MPPIIGNTCKLLTFRHLVPKSLLIHLVVVTQLVYPAVLITVGFGFNTLFMSRQFDSATSQLGTKTDNVEAKIHELDREIKADLREQRRDIKADLHQQKVDIKTDLHEQKIEIKANYEGLKEDLRDVKADISSISHDVKKLIFRQVDARQQSAAEQKEFL